MLVGGGPSRPSPEWIHQAALAIRFVIPIGILDLVAQFPACSEAFLRAFNLRALAK